MLSTIPHGALPIVIGIITVTIHLILSTLSAWKSDASRLHSLKVETHSLRLRLKKQSAQRIYAEERHRESMAHVHAQAAAQASAPAEVLVV